VLFIYYLYTVTYFWPTLYYKLSLFHNFATCISWILVTFSHLVIRCIRKFSLPMLADINGCVLSFVVYSKSAEIPLSQSTTMLFDKCRQHIEKLDDKENINRVWKNIRENIKTSAKQSVSLYELEQHKPRFDEECWRFSDQRKQAEMQWLQDPDQSNVDNVHNVRRDAGRHFRKEQKEYLKVKTD